VTPQNNFSGYELSTSGKSQGGGVAVEPGAQWPGYFRGPLK